MKMSSATYAVLKAAVEHDMAPNASERRRWEALLWPTTPHPGLVSRLYAEGLDDVHIDTALRKIAKEKTNVRTRTEPA